MVMKMFLKISLLLNLGLAGGLIFMLLGGQKQMAGPPLQLMAATPALVNTNFSAPPPVPVPEVTKPFCWSQLDSKNYHVFVKNLRATGCPERTLRAIVVADVDTIFRQRGDELEKKLDDLDQGSWAVQLSSYNQQQALKAEVQKLPGQEAAAVDNFLDSRTDPTEITAPMASASRSWQGGSLPSSRQITAALAADSPAGTSAVGASAAAISEAGLDSRPSAASASDPAATVYQPWYGKQTAQLPPAPKGAALPVVFQPVDQTAMGLNETQMQAVNDVRQSFLNSISGSSQNPNDPAYQQLWQQAQSQSDALSEIYLGYNLYIKLWTAQYQK
jgi:hypothetical protein